MPNVERWQIKRHRAHSKRVSTGIVTLSASRAPKNYQLHNVESNSVACGRCAKWCHLKLLGNKKPKKTK